MENYCHYHPCLKADDEKACSDQIFLGQLGTQKLCSKEKTDCPLFHPLAFGRFEPEDRICLKTNRE